VTQDERICLSCKLPDCDETDPGCLLVLPLRVANQRWYAKLKKDPVRHAAYKTKKRAIKDAWLKTDRGRELYSAQCYRYQVAHPDQIKQIRRDSHARHREARNADSRARRLKRKQEKEEASIVLIVAIIYWIICQETSWRS